MNNECDKCGEHVLECVCDDESLTTCSELQAGLAASIIKRNLEETQLTLALQSLEEAGMKEEFGQFLKETKQENIFYSMREFAKLHPDKFHVPDLMESYGRFIVLG